MAIQDQVVSTCNYKSYISKDSVITNDTCRKCRGKSETFQPLTGAHLALTAGDYIHRRNKVADVFHQELTIKYGLSKGPPVRIINMSHISVTELMNCIFTDP